jgi:hypothetical protein
MISKISLPTDCFAPCKAKILSCEPRGLFLVAFWRGIQICLGPPLVDYPEVAVARAGTGAKFKNSALCEWGWLQGFGELDSGLLIWVLSPNGREN